MGYTPTNWHTGDTITEEKLNNIEAGIADGGLPKNIQTTQTIFDGTYEFSSEEGFYVSREIQGGTALVVGNTYIVTFDGTEYSCVCEYSPDMRINYIGSISIVSGESGDYPFAIAYSNGYRILTTSPGSSHSVKLKRDIASVQPGTAMIFDGTKWTQQSGYGYVAAGQTISWDGDIAGRDNVLLFGTTFYKVSDAIVEDFSGWTLSVNGDTFPVVSQPGTNCVLAGDNLGPCAISFSDTSAEFSLDSITAPSVGTYMNSPATLQENSVQVFDAKLLPAATDSPTNVFDTDDDTPLSEIAEAYNKYGTVYLRIDRYTFGTGIPHSTRYGLARFEFPIKRYTLNGASGNSNITLEFRFYADGTGFTDRSNPQIYTIPLTWAGQ